MIKVVGEWKVASENHCLKEELKSFEMISYELRGLQPDTKYRMELRAHNILGFSLPAQLYVQTALGEYNQESNEVPLRAGFYDVYTAPDPLAPTSGSTRIAHLLGPVLLFALYFVLWFVTFFCICTSAWHLF